MQHFDQELVALKERLLVMASQAESAVNLAIAALVERDDHRAETVKEQDTVIDQLEMEIDQTAINLLAKAPLAFDLRLITVAMKICRDLERVGDEATAIARRALELNREPQLKPYIDIPRMAALALEMLGQALDAFIRRDAAQARAIIPRDKEVDVLNKQLQRELVSFMVENPATITRCLNLMAVSRRLERIADHATNIAEQVVFLLDACDIRHAARGNS